jgi:hypothetical protein
VVPERRAIVPEDLQRIIESATRAGLELDPAEAQRWMEAVSAEGAGEVTLDHRSGVFGHRVAMLDFSPADLTFFRSVGAIVEIPDEEGVETALALSGSAAQSKIQTYPGDCDFFERINVHAATRDEACARFADVLRRKALARVEGDTYRLMEVKFGQYPTDVLRNGALLRAGSPVSWSPAEVASGEIAVQTPAGGPQVLRWSDLAGSPGWCKIDWVIADPVRKQLANASNMLDATWEAPDGSIVPLDGFLDPYFQEVYLDATDVPLFSKLAQHVSADALDDYVVSLEGEVRKYLGGDHPNVGKAAKRMYNVFRLNGRYVEAAFLRELFDEPTTVLYQVYSVMRTIEEASEPGSSVDRDTVVEQVDRAVIEVVRALEGVEEEELVGQLLHLRDGVRDSAIDSALVVEARERLINLVNNFFHDKMTVMPEIRDYMAGMGA